MSAVIAPYSNGRIFDELKLWNLSASTRNLLCEFLNTPKLIPSEDNLHRDWRGLAELLGVAVSMDSKNPMDCVLSAWIRLKDNGPQPTVQVLLSLLGQIDRWDIHDDLIDIIENEFMRSTDEINSRSIVPSFSVVNEIDVITRDDSIRAIQGLPLQTYDAFFLYVDEDETFAKDIVSILEGEYGKKLCLSDRDLLGGLMFKHDAIMRLISNRCNHLIVILSDHFSHSEDYKFFFKYTQAISIHNSKFQRKIIPIARNARQLKFSSEFVMYCVLDLSRHSSFRTFCDKLNGSITPPLESNLPQLTENSCSSLRIEEIPPEEHSKMSVNLSSPEAEVQSGIVKMPDSNSVSFREECKSDGQVLAEAGPCSGTPPPKTESEYKNSKRGIKLSWLIKSKKHETTQDKNAERKSNKKSKSLIPLNKKKVALES